MKRIFTLSIFTLSLAACQNSEFSIPEDPAEQRDLLKTKKELLRETENQIAQLEEALLGQEVKANGSKLTPVKTLAVEPRVFKHFVQVPGLITSRQNVLLSAKTNGQVTRIPVSEGQKVKAGQVLIEQENSLVASQLNEARTAYRLAKTTYERRRRLWTDSIGSEIEFLNAETNFKTALNRVSQLETQYTNTFIKAPVNGTVDLISVNQGQYLGAGSPAVRLVDLSNLEVEAELSENYLRSVAVGDSVEVVFGNLGESQKQPLSFVSQYINPENRSFTLKAKLDNDQGQLKPNLLAEVRLRDYEAQDALVVPSIALKKDLKGDYLYVVKAKGKQHFVKKRYVKAGRSAGDRTEILEGLQAGDSIVAAGFNEVSDGQEVSLHQ